jgi:hypothetical protein
LPQTRFFCSGATLHIIYVDESGVPEQVQDSSHFVVAGLAIPARAWKEHDRQVRGIMGQARMPHVELHAAWLARRYPEQQRIANFESLDDSGRRIAVRAERKLDLAKASLRGPAAVKGLARNYKKTDAYLHLTHAERVAALRQIADMLGSWTDARLFADAQRKPDLSSSQRARSRETALEQVTTRFNTFLSKTQGGDGLGIVVHDQHQAESVHLTTLFREWHEKGTKFSHIPRIAETPLFVDSSLTLMVQLADLAAFAIRRFFDRGEVDLLDRIYGRFDRDRWGKVVGLRHYTAKASCTCRACKDHGRDSS